MIEKIKILQHGKGSHFGSHPSEEAFWLLCIIAYHHEVVVQLRKDRLDSLSKALVCPRRLSPVLLVKPIRHFKSDVCCIKKILLYRSAQVSLVSEDHAVMVLPLNIFEIVQVMYVGGGHIIRMYNATHTTQGMELISIIVHILRCAVSPCRCVFYISLAHGTPTCSCILTYLYWFGVNAEDGLSAIYCFGNGLANFLTKTSGQFATLVELTAGYKVGNSTRTLCVQAVEEKVLAVNTECLCRNGKCDHLYIRECGDNTTTRDISLLIYTISCKLFADLKNFSELCDEVVHIYDNST